MSFAASYIQRMFESEESKVVRLKLLGFSDSPYLRVYLKDFSGMDENGTFIRNPGKQTLRSLVRSMLFGIADVLKGARVRDFKLENTSPYFPSQINAFVSWYLARFDRLVKFV